MSAGYAIDNRDRVAGSSQFRSGGNIVHATLFRGRHRIDLGVLAEAGNISVATGIANNGEIVGYGAPNPGSTNTRAFIWDAANGMRDLGTIGGDASIGAFINARGHVTGTSTINGVDDRRHAFLYKHAHMRDLGSLDPGSDEGDFSTAYGLNMQDNVVGITFRPSGGGTPEQAAFVWKGGTMSDLETLVDASGAGYRLLVATAVNNSGAIAVRASKAGETHAVLLTPAR